MKTSFCGIVLLLACVAVSSAQAGIIYGISNGFGTPGNNQIYQINPANGDLSNIMQVTLAGHTVSNSQALTTNPLNNTLYAIIQTTPTGGGAAGRRLVTVDPATGVATLIGTLGRNFSSLAFKADGTLLGVTGDGATPPETLFQISTADATSTQLFALGNGADGETIAMHPNGLLYHSSGSGTALFESVDVNTQAVTPIGSASGEAFAMGYIPDLGQMLLSDISSNLFNVDIATGARTLIGGMADQLGPADNRGLAFVPAVVPEPGTLALGLSGALGLASWRKRRVKMCNG